MKRKDLLRVLARLGKKLEERNMTGDLLLTGGASMCLVHSARDATKDIDAIYEPKGIINQLAREVAQEEGLPDSWLNDSVKGFLTPAVKQETFLEIGGLRVSTVSADYLLAMKLMASRYGETDYEDIRFLFEKLEIADADTARRLVSKYYPPERILPKVRYVIDETLEDINASVEDYER